MVGTEQAEDVLLMVHNDHPLWMTGASVSDDGRCGGSTWGPFCPALLIGSVRRGRGCAMWGRVAGLGQTKVWR